MNFSIVRRHFKNGLESLRCAPEATPPRPELPPILILTIPEGSHRLLTTQDRLTAAGITGHRPFVGVSKYVEGFENGCLHQISPHKSLKEAGLSPGAIACGMSHVLLWSYLFKSSHDRYIILEDDAMPQASLDYILDAFAMLPRDADFAALHSFGAEAANRDITINLEDCQNDYWLRTRRCSNTLPAYYLTRHGARHLLQTCIPYWQPIDQMVQNATSTLTAYQIKPEHPLFNPDYDMGSLINDKH